MPRFNRFTQSISKSAGLGFAALLTNGALVAILGTELTIHPGNIFIFAAMLALGFWGGLTSIMVGTVPLAIYLGTPGEIVRILALCVLIGSITRKTHKVNCTSLVVLSWLITLGPMNSYISNNESLGELVFPLTRSWLFWSDVLCSTIAGLLLLNTNIWCRITNTPRHVPLSALTSHLLSGVAVFAVFSGYWLSRGESLSPWNLVLFVSTVQLGSTFVGSKVAQYLIDNFRSLSRDTLNKKEDTSTFSGLSTEHWRRKEKYEKRVTSKGSWRRPNNLGPATVEQSEEEISRASKEGVCVCNVRGTIVFANRPFSEMVGIKSENFIGKRFDTVGVLDVWYTPLMEIAQETHEKGPRIRELKLSSSSNRLVFYELSARPASPTADMLSGGEPDNIIITIRDITERRSIESGLFKAQRLESIGALMTGLAHEFSNSLTSITAKASLGSSDSASLEQSKNSLKEIVQFARSAGQTVQGLLDFAGGTNEKVSKTNLSKLISERLSLLRRLVGENYDITFTCSNHHIGTTCNKGLLIQAITNLVIYARDAYTDGSGQIKITLDTEEISEAVTSLPIGVKPGHFSRFRIEHSGLRMNRDVIAKAFDPSLSDRSSSLGLSIVYAVVRAHDGFLTAESHPAKGTTISVYFPLVEADYLTEEIIQIPVHDSKETTEAMPGGRILVVEDEPNVRELTSYMLSELGYKVLSCDNGNEAINLAQNNTFDLVLVDYVIPKIGGAELLQQLRGTQTGVKTLVMTGYGSTIASEVDSQIIQKPFDMDSLANAVKKALKSSAEIPPSLSQTHQR